MRYRLFPSVVVLLLFPLCCFAQRGKVKLFETDSPTPEIFLRPVKAVGNVAISQILLRGTSGECLAENGQQIPHCLVLPPQGDTLEIEELNLGTMVIPAKALRDVIIVLPRFGPTINLKNNTSTTQLAGFYLQLTTTIESPALLDPRAVDPSTGEPLNGQLETTFGPRWVEITLQPGEAFRDSITYTRHGFTGRSWFLNTMKLPKDIVDAIFDQEITLRCNVRGSVRLAVGGNIVAWFHVQGY